MTDFKLPESSEWAAEIIKEGFTLEFMKNAIIRYNNIFREATLNVVLFGWRNIDRKIQ